MLIILYAVISICFFLYWADRSKLREYYSSLLCISCMRFLEQYVLVYILQVWKYKNLPTSLAKIIEVPILLDVTFFPMLGYIIIRYMQIKFKSTITNYLIMAAALTAIESTMVLSGMLEHHKYWNFIFSYFLALVTVIMIHLQYRLFLRTGWYQTGSDF